MNVPIKPAVAAAITSFVIMMCFAGPELKKLASDETSKSLPQPKALNSGDVLITGLKYPAVYVLRSSANGDIRITEPKVVTMGDTPVPPPTPTTLSGVVRSQLSQIKDGRAKDIIAASLYVGCSNISDDLDSGKIDIGQAADAWKGVYNADGSVRQAGVLTILDGQPEWENLETALRAQLTKMQLNDELETKEDWAAAFRTIANALAGGPGESRLTDLIDKLSDLFEGLDPVKLLKWIEIIRLILSGI